MGRPTMSVTVEHNAYMYQRTAEPSPSEHKDFSTSRAKASSGRASWGRSYCPSSSVPQTVGVAELSSTSTETETGTAGSCGVILVKCAIPRAELKTFVHRRHSTCILGDIYR